MTSTSAADGFRLTTAKHFMSSALNRHSSTLGYLSAAPRVSTRPQAAGGPRSHVLGVMSGFQAQGWQVEPFIVGDHVPESWSAQKSEASINRGWLRPLVADAMRIGMGLQNARRAWNELGRGVDWVYERNAALQTLGPAFQRRGIPWILETNAPLFYEAKVERKTIALAPLARQLELKAYRDCDVLVCITTALRDVIVGEGKISPDKIVIMPNGVDISFFDPERLPDTGAANIDKNPPEAPLTIGYVGKLLESQGVDLLLHALRDLLYESLDLRVIVVGDGPARSELEALSTALSLNHLVQFMGQVTRDEIPNHLAQFDVGYSGQQQLPIGVMYRSPLKLYEYMAMEKPVVASNFEDAERLIDDGKTGYLFEPGSKESLKASLRKAAAQRHALKQMGQAARKQVVAHHSWSARVAALINSIEEILAAK